jgi:hypothetical protein
MHFNDNFRAVPPLKLDQVIEPQNYIDEFISGVTANVEFENLL